jgi:phosphoserine/homoserine phosphotransferase
MSSSDARQSIVTLDLEGVLVPEIWIAVAERTGIDELRRTTREEPDYDVLMAGRLKILADHGLGMNEVAEVIAGLSPVEGAREFLDALRAQTQVVILSDTFEEFARPLMAQLGWPTIMCHRLVVEASGNISGYRLRQSDQKRHAVEAFHSLNFRVFSAGDSYNDTAMLTAAERGFLFRSPKNVQDEFPQFRAIERFEDLLEAFEECLRSDL